MIDVNKDPKYYTPALEELHIGMEIEIMVGVGYNNEWEKDVIRLTNSDGVYISMLDMLDDGCDAVRVKYLDREDAESLGWIFKTGHKLTEWYKGQEDWFCERLPGDTPHKFWEHELLIHPTDHTIKIKCKTDSGDWEMFFEGYCKNKSELAKLMQMINIGQNHDGYKPKG